MKKKISFSSIRKFFAHPVVSGSALLVIGSMGINVINLLYHFVMGKFLGPVDYGILLSLYSVLYILSIVPISSSVSIVKFISKAKNKKERSAVYLGIRKLIFYIAAIGAVLVILASPLIARFLNLNDSLNVIFTGVVLFFSLITLVNQASSQGILKFMGVVVPNFVSSFTKFALGILLVIVGFSVRGAMFAVLAGIILAYFLSVRMLGDFFKGASKEKFELRPFLKYSGPVLLQALAFTSFFTTDVILVKHFFSPFDAGLYGSLSTLGKIVYFGASPVAAAMFPYISSKHARGEKYQEVLFGAIGVTLIISMGVVAIYLIFPQLVIEILYGSKYLSASSDLVWMGIFIAFYTVSNLLVNFFLSIDKVKVVIVPLLFAIAQIILLWFYHSSLLQVIQISLFLMVGLSVILSVYLVYNRLSYKRSLEVSYAKK